MGISRVISGLVGISYGYHKYCGSHSSWEYCKCFGIASIAVDWVLYVGL